jgi:Ser/Thr protein kinase RdoA (MazF antagonist)
MGASGDQPRATRLLQQAISKLGLRIQRVVPVSDSFSSSVLSFVTTHGQHLVLKLPWSRVKAEREIRALDLLQNHAFVPNLVDTLEIEGELILLIQGLGGEPWQESWELPPKSLYDIGLAVAQIHEVSVEGYSGPASWESFLQENAREYIQRITGDDRDLAQIALQILSENIDIVDFSGSAQLVHFDLRPGNVLVRELNFVGIIDFESWRGGHASMDFYKFWEHFAKTGHNGLDLICKAYRDSVSDAEDWMDPNELAELMKLYSAYHGLAGLSWCYTRNNFEGDFPVRNRQRIQDAIQFFSVP